MNRVVAVLDRSFQVVGDPDYGLGEHAHERHARDVQELPARGDEPRVGNEAAKLDQPVHRLPTGARGRQRDPQRLVQRVTRAQRLRRRDAHHW